MATFINDFISLHVETLWGGLTSEFGRMVDYWVAGDEAQAIPAEVIWIEGSEAEEISPGRYSRAHIRNDSLPAGPALGDALEKDGTIYDVVLVNAYAYYYATITLQERPSAIAPPPPLTWDEIPGTWDEIPGTFDEVGQP